MTKINATNDSDGYDNGDRIGDDAGVTAERTFAPDEILIQLRSLITPLRKRN